MAKAAQHPQVVAGAMLHISVAPEVKSPGSFPSSPESKPSFRSLGCGLGSQETAALPGYGKEFYWDFLGENAQALAGARLALPPSMNYDYLFENFLERPPRIL